MNDKQLQQPNEVDKQRPPYEVKIIKLNGENAIRSLLHKQQKYNVEDVVINRMMNRLFKYLEESYGSIANVRLFSKGMSLQPLITEAVNHLFGKKKWELESLKEISDKIITSSHSDKLEILISVRAFLFDNPEINGLIFDSFSTYDDVLEKNIFKSNTEIKIANEQHIKKIGLKCQDLFLLPKNKKNSLINLVDSLLDDYNCKIIFDKCRADPFLSDDLYIFINQNINHFSKKNIEVFEKRSKELTDLINYANIQKETYETCLTISRKNKIKYYWVNIWGLSKTYKNPGVIENLLLWKKHS